jgi:hypothetical protein
MDTKIILSATWVVVTLIYLYGDVLRICSGDLAKKPMADKNLNQFVWLGDCGSNVDAHPDGFPDPDIAPVCESLGEYHRGCLLFPVQPDWPAHLSIVI